MYDKKINALILKEYEKENHQCYICEDENYLYFTNRGYAAYKMHKKVTPFSFSSLSNVFRSCDLTNFFKLSENAKPAAITGIEKIICPTKGKKETICQIKGGNIETWIKKDYLKPIEGSFTKIYITEKLKPVLFETITGNIDFLIMPFKAD